MLIRMSEYFEDKTHPLVAQRLGPSKAVPLVTCMTFYRENFTLLMWGQKCAEVAACYTSNRSMVVKKNLKLLCLPVNPERSTKNGTSTL